MEIRKCPNCGKTDRSGFGFCIYCGKEFTPENSPIIHIPEPTIFAQEPNEKTSDNTPNITENKEKNTDNNPTTLTRNQEYINEEPITPEFDKPKRSFGMNFLIFLGYVLAIIGSMLGIIVSIYLVTRKDYNIKRHGVIQLAIYAFYIVLLIILFANGTINMDTITHIGQMEYNNLTSLFRR